MIDLSDCILLGTITKTHGFRGQVIIGLNNINSQRIQKMEWVFIEIDGLPVPFFISECSVRDSNSLLIHLKDIKDKDKAKELLDNKVFVSSLTENIIPSQLTDAENLIGYKVMDKNAGELGFIKDIIQIQENPLLSIISAKKEILLPACDEFILEINTREKIVFIDAPKGLVELS